MTLQEQAAQDSKWTELADKLQAASLTLHRWFGTGYNPALIPAMESLEHVSATLKPYLLSLGGRLQTCKGVCAEAYQLAGAVGAPVAVLDNLSDASRGMPLRHETFLPVSPDDCTEISGLRAELTEARELAEDQRQARIEAVVQFDRELTEARTILQRLADEATRIMEDFPVARGLGPYDSPNKLVHGQMEWLATELKAAKGQLEIARKAIEDAPHSYIPALGTTCDGKPLGCVSTCWKFRALSQITPTETK